RRSSPRSGRSTRRAGRTARGGWPFPRGYRRPCGRKRPASRSLGRRSASRSGRCFWLRGRREGSRARERGRKSIKVAVSMRRFAVLAVVAAALLAWIFLGRPRWAKPLLPARAPRNLLLVSIDTLRADRLGSYGHAEAQTPRLDALARSALRFAQATPVAPVTLPPHSSLLTGTSPAWHGVRDNGGFYPGDDQTTLAEVLRAKGFRTGGFVGAFVLDRRWGISQGFDRYFDE